MSAGRGVWVKIRASEAERAEWHAKARSAGLTLSDLLRRSVGRVRTWTVAHADVERERTRELARIGNNLNQIARWANTHGSEAEAVEVVAEGLCPRSTRGSRRLMMRRVSQAGTGDGIRETALPARCPGSGAGSWGFKGGRSVPLARPQCSTLRGLA